MLNIKLDFGITQANIRPYQDDKKKLSDTFDKRIDERVGGVKELIG